MIPGLIISAIPTSIVILLPFFPEFKIFETGIFDHMHKVRLDLHLECIFIFEQYFLSQFEPLAFEVFSEMKDFLYNCPEQHVKDMYEFHKKVLKCIFHGSKYI